MACHINPVQMSKQTLKRERKRKKEKERERRGEIWTGPIDTALRVVVKQWNAVCWWTGKPGRLGLYGVEVLCVPPLIYRLQSSRESVYELSLAAR